MGVFGIKMDEFEGKVPGAGWIPPDPGRQEFQITGITEGVNSQGEHAGERYVTAKCVQISGDDPGTKVHSQYLGLSDKLGKWGRPIEQTVGYLKAWGRYDLLEAGEDADTQNLIDTTFSADVKIKTGADGNPKVSLSNIIPISHAPAEEPPVAAVAAPVAAAPAVAQPTTAPQPRPAPAPTVMRRGR
jgi:hypothetical protein